MNDFIYYGVISEVQGTKARAAIRGGGVTGFFTCFSASLRFQMQLDAYHGA